MGNRFDRSVVFNLLYLILVSGHFLVGYTCDVLLAFEFDIYFNYM